MARRRKKNLKVKYLPKTSQTWEAGGIPAVLTHFLKFSEKKVMIDF